MRKAATLLSAIALGSGALAIDAGVLATEAQAAGEPVRPLTIWARTQAANPQAYQAAHQGSTSGTTRGVSLLLCDPGNRAVGHRHQGGSLQGSGENKTRNQHDS